MNERIDKGIFRWFGHMEKDRIAKRSMKGRGEETLAQEPNFLRPLSDIFVRVCTNFQCRNLNII